jgi:hypothetical protein
MEDVTQWKIEASEPLSPRELQIISAIANLAALFNTMVVELDKRTPLAEKTAVARAHTVDLLEGHFPDLKFHPPADEE